MSNLFSFRENALASVVRWGFKKLDRLYALSKQTKSNTTTQSPNFVSKEAVLYIHFPFCESACNYCPFSKTLNPKESSSYCKALLNEIELYKNACKDTSPNIKALFFGGGTPSLIEPHNLSEILNLLHKRFGEIPQITMECNPESLTRERLQAYFSLGITRLSIGAQSFQDKILSELGREHSGELIEKAVTIAREVGFTNISIDLIYGFSHQNEENFLSDIERALSLPINHISFFPLINSNKNERQALPTKLFKKQLAIYKAARKRVESAGFYAYSIEDFAKIEAAENLYQKAVWEIPQKDMLILGTSGFGMANNFNYSKIKSIPKYIAEVKEGHIPIATSFQSPIEKVQLRRFLMGLHYNSISIEEFQRHYGINPKKKYKWILLLLQTLGLIQSGEKEIALTETGAFVTSLIWAKVMLSRMKK